uniref:Uncharacterized protein n=1 Tax=Rhizophora mucronata TaxID=61149 RepID=A0A2P2LJG7_RHIMU
MLATQIGGNGVNSGRTRPAASLALQSEDVEKASVDR